MRKALMITAYLINSIIIMPFIIIWAVAGVIATTIWTIFEVYDGPDDF